MSSLAFAGQTEFVEQVFVQEGSHQVTLQTFEGDQLYEIDILVDGHYVTCLHSIPENLLAHAMSKAKGRLKSIVAFYEGQSLK